MTRTVAHFIDTVAYGGAEQAVRHLLQALDHTRWRPVLLHHDAPALQPLFDAADDAGVRRRLVEPMRGPGGVRAMASFARVLRDERPDVLHAHLNWPLACSGGILTAAACRVPAVVATVQLFSEIPRAITMPLQQRLVTRAVDRYIAVSAAVAADLETRLRVRGDRIRIVPNGVDVTAFDAPHPPGPSAGLRTELGIPPGMPIVVSLARLDRQKGLTYLLQAAAQLTSVAFVVAGEGPERSALVREAQALGVADRVFLIGFRRDTAALLAGADVFVLPSLIEGLPLAVLEAMAARRPVVATGVGGTPEVVRHGQTGLLVPPADPPALAAAIRRLLADTALGERLVEAARTLVLERFSATANAVATTAVYDELLGPAAPAPSPRPGSSASAPRRSFGDLRRVTPFSRVFGFDLGTPADRRFIEGFLARHARDVHGRVLEVKDDSYTRQFGGSRVTARDVLDVDPGNPKATIVDDLAAGARLPSDAFDCVILTQTMQLVFDVRAAIATLHRILKPGGVALVTVPGITQIPREEAGSWYWSFTEVSASRLFAAAFGTEFVHVESHGNVLVAAAFLYGVPAQELRDEELDAADPDYPVTITIRAVKAGAPL